ncbi:CPBP family intramembrane glutamic endopeptidase [Terrisporobacter petrolearius]
MSYALPTLLISISFTYVYVKTKDIKYNIILHMLYNFLCIFTL